MTAKKALKRGKPGSQDTVDAALAHFKKVDPVIYQAALPFRTVLKESRSTAQRRYSTNILFEALAGSITGQQLSTKAADSIWGRLKERCDGAVTPEAITRLRTVSLRACGLSNAKVKSLKELSKTILKGELDLNALRKVPEEEAIEKLSSVWGIGKWTAEMFLMFALDRADVFSPGDLGLRRSMETLYALPKDVHVKELELLAERWRPYRTIACRILWRARDVPTPKAISG
jgi:DNA-3-methyladenine glycosylase II